MTVRCPAKINTFLSVGPLDAVGYHPIVTVFQAVSLSDTLVLERADADSFFCDSAVIPDENTVTKAWRLAKEYVGLPQLAVSLEKNIPAQSGLGGGSSDAAGFLRALVKMTAGRFGEREAMEVAAAVGSDVPFFMVGGRAMGEGYGERVTALEDLARQSVVIVMPEATVSTPGAYKKLDELPRVLRSPQDLTENANDFEAVCPEPSQSALDRLRATATGPCGLSGSGAAVFAFASDEEEAHQIARLAENEALGRAFVCTTLSQKESLWIS